MNATALSLDREVEVQSKIRKVSKFSRNARAVCAAIFGFGLVTSVVVLLPRRCVRRHRPALFGPGPYAGHGVAGLEPVTTAQFTMAQLNTPGLTLWGLLVFGTVTGVGLAAVYQLYRLFGNLAAGAIYTPENVRRLRHVGVLWLLAALLGIVIPCVAAMLVELGFFDRRGPAISSSRFSLSESLTSFIRGRPHPARFVDHGRRPVRERTCGRAEARRRSRDLNGASTCLSS